MLYMAPRVRRPSPAPLRYASSPMKNGRGEGVAFWLLAKWWCCGHFALTGVFDVPPSEF
jgi:hypothetical protein